MIVMQESASFLLTARPTDARIILMNPVGNSLQAQASSRSRIGRKQPQPKKEHSMKTPLFLLLAAFLLSVSGLQAGTGDKVFRKADKNGDGKVSSEEFIVLIPNDPDKAAKRFKKIDHDNDGFASLEEIVAFYDKK
jgi:hypothetical protein